MGGNGAGRQNVNLYLGLGHENAVVNSLQALQPGTNLAVDASIGAQQAAVNAIRQILEGNPNLVNLLRVPGEQQVMLMVTVAEVNRTAARTIGMDFSIVNGRFAMAQITGGLLTPGSVAQGAVQALTNVGGNLPTAIDNGNVLMAIQALRTLNFARSLAEPNLTTLNGKPANFTAGGSFPIPTSVVTPGGAAQSVSYQNFGIQLQFIPYITDRDRIRLQLNASVSTPAITTTQVSGAQVPSQIAQRSFSNTVELREGQTLTVAGLIQNNFNGTSKRIPLWGDLPIIGRTGGNDSLTSGEQELVILVTPLLVHPLELCKTPACPAATCSSRATSSFICWDIWKAGIAGLSNFGSHRLRPPRAIHPLQRPVHYRLARHHLRLLQALRPVSGAMPESLSGCGNQQQRLASGISNRKASNTRGPVEDGFHAPSKRNFTTLRDQLGSVHNGGRRRLSFLQRHCARSHSAAQRNLRLPVDSCGERPRFAGQLCNLSI